MQRNILLSMLLVACCLTGTHAQIKISENSFQKTAAVQIPMVHNTTVASQFTGLQIDTVNAFTISLKPAMAMQVQNAACEYFRHLAPTLALTAERINDFAASLEWKTKYAFFATGFAVERSWADTFHFRDINFTNAREESSYRKDYQLEDYNEYSGISFYRIRQLNGNSAFAYSNIVAIKGFEIMPFRIYPNPASNNVSVDITSLQGGIGGITIYNAAGNKVIRQALFLNAKSALTKNINISKLVPGHYQLKMDMPGGTLATGKFIKQ